MKHISIKGGLLIVLLSCRCAVLAQELIPRDTSYSRWSAHKKIIKVFPEAKLVEIGESEQLEIARDEVYYSVNGRDLHYDLYLPKLNRQEKLPLIICIHGGGWASGDKILLEPMAIRIAESGYVTACLEYRLSPEALYPAAIQDIKSAIVYFKKNADELGVDKSQVVVLGTSAGATLASFVGANAANAQFSPNNSGLGINDRVHAIINIDGIVDFTHPAESGKDTIPGKLSAAARWFGVVYSEDPGLWQEASPLSHVGDDCPPILFINSSIPRFHAGRDRFLQEIDQFGTYHEVHEIPESPHSFWLFEPWFDETIVDVLSFLSRVLN